MGCRSNIEQELLDASAVSDCYKLITILNHLRPTDYYRLSRDVCETLLSNIVSISAADAECSVNVLNVLLYVCGHKMSADALDSAAKSYRDYQNALGLSIIHDYQTSIESRMLDVEKNKAIVGDPTDPKVLSL